MDDLEAEEDRRETKRRWKRARAAAMYALLEIDYREITILFDRHPRWLRKALKRTIESRLPLKLQGSQHPAARLRRLREKVRMVAGDELDDVVEQIRIDRLRAEVFAPFGAGRVLYAN